MNPHNFTIQLPLHRPPDSEHALSQEQKRQEDGDCLEPEGDGPEALEGGEFVLALDDVDLEEGAEEDEEGEDEVESDCESIFEYFIASITQGTKWNEVELFGLVWMQKFRDLS
jgi:hypothetical protein